MIYGGPAARSATQNFPGGVLGGVLDAGDPVPTIECLLHFFLIFLLFARRSGNQSGRLRLRMLTTATEPRPLVVSCMLGQCTLRVD